MSVDETTTPNDHPDRPNASASPSEGARPPVVTADPRLLVRRPGSAGHLDAFRRRLGGGDLGAVPVVVGLAAIWGVFQTLNPAFLSAQNLSNIAVAMVATGMMSVGVTFVLLLGEIDLSVGSVSGVGGALFALLAVTHGVDEWVALVCAVATGAIIGAVHGVVFARLGAPAFAVTLAGLLFWNGLMLRLLGSNGTINIDSEGVVGALTTHYFSDVAAAHGLATLAVVGYGAAALRDTRRRIAAGIPARSPGEIALRTGLLACVAYAAATVLNQYKGLPLATALFLAVLVTMDFLLRRTAYGRKVTALGGGVEASRRAGVDVAAVRVSVFALSGFFAAVGGLFWASKIAAANQSAGSGDLLMNVIAAAVIGGTSLFGGRGRVWNALLGVMVITSIQYGLALQGVGAPVQYMITGGVLLATVVLDSATRRSRRTAGRG